MALRSGAVAVVVATLMRCSASDAITFVVSSIEDAHDATPGDSTCATAVGACTIRAAIEEANASPGADVVSLPKGRFSVSLGLITISEKLDIIGSGADESLIKTKPNQFLVRNYFALLGDGNSFEARFQDLTLVRTAVRTVDPFLVAEGPHLIMERVRVLGGIASTVAAVDIGEFTTGTLNDVTISGNKFGMGIQNCGTISLTNVAVLRNRNGGVFLGYCVSNGIEHGVAELTNVTVAHNRGIHDTSHGLYAGGVRAALTNVTIAKNRSPFARGLYAGPSTTVRNVIVADGCNGPGATSLGNNLDVGTSCGFTAPGDRENSEALLRGARLNGGFSPTMALSAGSPAIDGGNGAVCPATDQRGVPRPQGSGCDIGAYEFQP